ncbi:hypothetical protein OAA59_02430 [bacterium]|nr:hypothetical protein [bacterium]
MIGILTAALPNLLVRLWHHLTRCRRQFWLLMGLMLRKLWMDGGYSGKLFADWVKVQRPKLKVEVVKRSDDMEGFEVSRDGG